MVTLTWQHRQDAKNWTPFIHRDRFICYVSLGELKFSLKRQWGFYKTLGNARIWDLATKTTEHRYTISDTVWLALMKRMDYLLVTNGSLGHIVSTKSA